MGPGDRTVDPAVFRSKLDASGVTVVVVHQPHPGRSASFPTQHAALEAAADAHLLSTETARWPSGAWDPGRTSEELSVAQRPFASRGGRLSSRGGRL